MKAHCCEVRIQLNAKFKLLFDQSSACQPAVQTERLKLTNLRGKHKQPSSRRPVTSFPCFYFDKISIRAMWVRQMENHKYSTA